MPKYVTKRDLRHETMQIERHLLARMEETHKALKLARSEITRVPTELDRRLESSAKLFDEKITTLRERIGQQHTLLEAMESNLNKQVNELTARVTEATSIGIGRKEVSGPMLAVIGSIVATVLAAGIVYLLNARPPTQILEYSMPHPSVEKAP